MAIRPGLPLFLFLLLAAAPATAAEIVRADGRRETVKEPRRGSKGDWTVEIGGRRVAARPGDVVAIVDDEGNETVLIPPLAEGEAGPEEAAMLRSLCDPKNGEWFAAAEALAMRPARGVLDALKALARDPKKEMRGRAYHAMARLRTRESVAEAARAILAEKDAALRREASSILFSVQEIFRRCEAVQSVEKGLADRDAGVRVTFALLAPREAEAAAAVLRADGIRHSDHHVRESAALALGKRGDRSGEGILVSMLARSALPGFEGDRASMERFLVAEQVEVCGILGGFGTPAAKGALAKAASSRFEAVREAARKALAAAPA